MVDVFNRGIQRRMVEVIAPQESNVTTQQEAQG